MGWLVSLPSSQPPNKLGKSFMQPRIYTYKITFEEIPDWYWGVHKETKYNDGYLGSPIAHAWKWEFYTPHLQICEIFTHTDEGWTKAREVENRCILPDLNNPLCLNEHAGGFMSLESYRRGAQVACEIIHAEKDDLGRSIHTIKTLGKAHDKKDDLGRSVLGVKNAERLHEEKDGLGRSVQGIKNAERLHEEKDDLGKSVAAMKCHKEKDNLGRSIHAVKSAEKANSQKWKDPKHPELGEHHVHALRKIQRQNGYSQDKENRVKVG